MGETGNEPNCFLFSFWSASNFSTAKFPLSKLESSIGEDTFDTLSNKLGCNDDLRLKTNIYTYKKNKIDDH